MKDQEQYDVYRLSRKLRDIFSYDKSPTIKSYIGVSSQNLGSKDSNFLFGGSDGSYGVITYYNFTAVNNHEPENRARLVKRLLKHYTKALALDPQNALIHYNKALAHYSFSEFDKAIIHYDIAISINYTGSWKFNAALQKYRHKKYAPAMESNNRKCHKCHEKYDIVVEATVNLC